MPAGEGWMLDLIDEDFEIPGWIVVPGDLPPEAQAQWIATALDGVRELDSWDGGPLSPDVARQLLTAALELRAASDAMAVIQVWPAMGQTTAMCYIDVVASDSLPDWAGPDTVVHRLDEPHLGPGLQVSTRRTAVVEDVEISEQDDGVAVEIDLTSVSFVFDDGEVALMLSLAETFTPLAAITAPGLVETMRNLRLVRIPDGAAFVASEPRGVLATDEWDLETTG